MASKKAKAGRRCEKAKSLCCVCCKAVEDGKDEALLCEGQCQKWLHRYCASVTVDQYEELSSSEEPFLCFTCCITQHQQQITELRSEVEALKFEISQLKAQLQPRVANVKNQPPNFKQLIPCA